MSEDTTQEATAKVNSEEGEQCINVNSEENRLCNWHY